jgi:osmotically-inducible protein OsmY
MAVNAMAANAAGDGGRKAAGDDEITAWVQRTLKEDPRTRSSNISVSVERGIVQLSGTTKTLAARQYASLEAKKIAGVRGVIDEIRVQPIVRPDGEIARKARLQATALLQASPDIEVSVHDGVVTLRGKVMGHSEAREAELLASDVRGVRAIRNDLRIRLRFARLDTDVRGDVLEALDRDVYLTGLPIEVAVDDGYVTLTGKVGNLYQKERATGQATMVDGVRGVVNGLEIDPSLATGTRETATMDDEGVRAAVVAELGHDARVDARDISVRSAAGRVTLAGSVESASERLAAERDARDVSGVSRVENDLRVDSPHRDDVRIQSDVELFLSTDATLAHAGLKVNVKSGVVTLKGEVPDGWERAHAEELAMRPLGVARVVDKLKVAEDEPADESSAALERKIRDRLRWDWSTSFVAPRIEVTVKDGIATLDGSVDTWVQRLEAARGALSVEGIRMVDDDLSVVGSVGPSQSFYFPEDFLFDPWYLWTLPG